MTGAEILLVFLLSLVAVGALLYIAEEVRKGARKEPKYKHVPWDDIVSSSLAMARAAEPQPSGDEPAADDKFAPARAEIEVRRKQREEGRQAQQGGPKDAKALLEAAVAEAKAAKAARAAEVAAAEPKPEQSEAQRRQAEKRQVPAVADKGQSAQQGRSQPGSKQVPQMPQVSAAKPSAARPAAAQAELKLEPLATAADGGPPRAGSILDSDVEASIDALLEEIGGERAPGATEPAEEASRPKSRRTPKSESGRTSSRSAKPKSESGRTSSRSPKPKSGRSNRAPAAS